MNDKNTKAIRYRKLRYGSFAVALTVVCVALVIVINTIFSALASKYMWYIDMTKEQIYGMSDASRIILDEYNGLEDFHISIIFCAPEDEIVGEYSTNLIYRCARQYEEEYAYVDIEFRDTITHPSSVEEFEYAASTKIKTTNVIITNGSDHRVLTLENFFTFDSDTGNVFAFNGEYRFTSSIVQLDGNNPIAYFVTGHGETNEGSVMYTLFKEAGYDVRTIDLTKENIDTNAKVVVINNPLYDYMGANDTVNEIAKIDHFLDNFGNLMVFRDGSNREFKELDELLSEWGIAFENAVIRDYSNSISVDGTELVAEYVTEGTGASLTKNLRASETPPKIIVN